MLGDAAPARMARYRDLLGPLIDQNFRQQPSAAPAFAQMTSQLADEITSPITGALSNCAARWCHSCSSGAGTTRICTSLPPSSYARSSGTARSMRWKRDTGRRSTPPRRLHGSCWGRERNENRHSCGKMAASHAAAGRAVLRGPGYISCFRSMRCICHRCRHLWRQDQPLHFRGGQPERATSEIASHARPHDVASPAAVARYARVEPGRNAHRMRLAPCRRFPSLDFSPACQGFWDRTIT